MELNKIKVLHIITELNIGGAERMLEKLVLGMDREKFENIVISMTDTGPLGLNIKNKGLEVIALDMDFGKPSFFKFLKLINIIKKKKPDVVQTWLYHADLMGLMAGKMAMVRKIVWGLRCSDMEFENYGFLTGMTVKLNARLSRLPDLILVNSEKGRQVHQGLGYSTPKMKMVPNGFDTNFFRPDALEKKAFRQEIGVDQNAFIVGHVARFDPQKDFETFFRAAGIIAQKVESAVFVLAGKGVDDSNKEIKQMISNNALADNVILLGSRENIEKLYVGLDCLILSSVFGEGFSNTIAEAMSCCVPCVVTDVGDSAYIVDDFGFVARPRDFAGLAEGVEKLSQMGIEQRQKIGVAARKRIKDNFSLEKIVDIYQDIYTKLADLSL